MITIEDSIIKGLLYNEEYSRKVYPYLDEKYFDGGYRQLFSIYKGLFDAYNSIPTLEAIAISLQQSSIGDSEYESVLEIVEKASKNREEFPDLDWLIDQTEEYCRDKAIYNAIYKSIGILDGSEKGLDKHAIPDLLDDALAVSFDTSIGMEFFDDAERRYELYTAEDSRIKFPLNALQILSNNGLKKKSLSVILAGPNIGKSSLMCYLSGEFLKQGLNVLYISGEMGEEIIHERVEANLLGIPTDNLPKLSREEYISKINSVKGKTHGKLFAKEYPTGAAHAGHIRNLLKDLKQKKKFTPNVIFVDYLNIFASSRYKSMSGVNSYSYVKAIAEELRGIGVEFDVPVVTATQVTRTGYSESTPDLTATSESFGVPATADFMIAITTDEVLQENNRQMLHLLKTRWGNKTKVKPQLVGINFDLMRYYDVDSTGNNMSTEEVKSKVGLNKPDFKKGKSEGIEWE